MDKQSTKKEKIIILTGIYPLFNGGAEYQMRIIADELKENYEIVFVYLGDIPERAVRRTHSRFIDGYKVVFLQGPSRLDSISLRVFYARRLYKLLESERPDFVYQRVLKFVSYYVSKFQKRLDYVHILHIADLYTLQFKRTSLREKVAYHFFRKMISNHPRFIVQTNEQGQLLEKYGVKSYVQIYNMHPTPTFSAEMLIERKRRESIKTIVWVGNLRPIKQLEVFLDLAATYQTNTDLQFAVIGNPLDTGYAEDMLKRIRGLKNVMHYTGKDNVFVNDFILQRTNLVVNTSESEGFSNVFIQSWLRGVPVLSLNSNPDNIFTKHPVLGAYCRNDLKLLEISLPKLLECSNHTKNALSCITLAKSYFSFENVEKVKSLLQ